MTEGAAQPPAAESDPPAQYHAIATFQFDGGVTATVDGLFTLPPGMTREAAYHGIRDHLAEAARAGQHLAGTPAVLFFSLEPNVLPLQP